jgi:predicted TIM-barrel fold metal-dependent hydrolase
MAKLMNGWFVVGGCLGMVTLVFVTFLGSCSPTPAPPPVGTCSSATAAVSGVPPASSSAFAIQQLRLADWEPKPMLVHQSTKIDRAKFPVIDIHNHLYRTRDQKRDVRKTIGIMNATGVQTVINLDGGYGESLRLQLKKFDQAYPGRFYTFAQLNYDGIDLPGWSERERNQLKQSFEAGARGLKIHKTLGLSIHDKTGKLIAIDDSRLDPVWELCGIMKRPVMIHSGDPAAFFEPLDRHNERWHELRDEPSWSYYGKKVPSRKSLWAQRNRVIARHPSTTFIGAHVANNPENLAEVSEWLEKYPNLHIDIDARISELGRQPYTARKFIIKYQDRILFGIDSYPSEVAYRTYFRFLETDDEYFDPGKGFNLQGVWRVYGLYLPEDVLKKVYQTNAKKLLNIQ